MNNVLWNLFLNSSVNKVIAGHFFRIYLLEIVHCIEEKLVRMIVPIGCLSLVDESFVVASEKKIDYILVTESIKSSKYLLT